MSVRDWDDIYIGKRGERRPDEQHEDREGE